MSNSAPTLAGQRWATHLTIGAIELAMAAMSGAVSTS
jgi:hypothetical protein